MELDTRQIMAGRVPAWILDGRYPLPWKRRRFEVDEDVARSVLEFIQAEGGLFQRLAEADWIGDGWLGVVDDAAEQARRKIEVAKEADDSATVRWWSYLVLYLSIGMKDAAERNGLALADLEQRYYDHVDQQFRRPEILLTMHCENRRRLKIDLKADEDKFLQDLLEGY